jgi:hypothetical protein
MFGAAQSQMMNPQMGPQMNPQLMAMAAQLIMAIMAQVQASMMPQQMPMGGGYGVMPPMGYGANMAPQGYPDQGMLGQPSPFAFR